MSSRTEPASHRISIVPSARRYVAQMEALQHLVYGTTPEAPADVLRAEHFRRHLKVFPEGQFVALDAGHVVGLTVSMRLAFDPANPFIEPWHITTGDG